MKSNLENYREEVSLKYNIYNSIFQTLGLEGINKTGILLPVFESYCREKLAEGKNPVEIVDNFLAEFVQQTKEESTTDVLFRFIKFIERQVVLVDALEDAAYGKINDVDGSGSFKSFYETAENRHALDALKISLEQLKVRLVLTAHPTQFYPGPVLGIIKDLSEAIKESRLNDIKQLLSQLGYTPFFKKQKPSPYDEAVNLIWFLENLFFQSIPAIYENMASQLGMDLNELSEKASSFQLGFWPGGDRDGNPFVNSSITLKVADRLRTSVLKSYYRDIRKLKRKLTFKEVEPIIIELEQLLYEGGFLDLLPPDFNEDSLVLRINEIRDILIQKYKGVYVKDITLFKLKVRAFGFHFATLDIRQDNDIIKQSFDELRNLNPYIFEGFDTHDLASYFTKQGSCNSRGFDDPVIQDTIDTFSTIKEIVSRNGKYGAYRYIISNCNSARSVARVYLMAKVLAFEGKLPLDVIPLFETIGDLQKASETMETLYKDPEYRAHIENRSNKQVIMLGFSDGTKDGGYITANWSIYKAKEEITRMSRDYGITAVFFDGRGGPPARGGGSTHKFYASMGQDIESEEIQLTVQGQTISSNFGTYESCKFNIEQLYTAGLENKVFRDQEKSLTQDQRKVLEELSSISGKAYLAFKEHPKFISYLENRSTLRFYNKANIGSRPSKRGRDKKLTLKDLRAIPFVGAWSQLKQNVPGFFGLGTAFEKMDKAGRLEEVSELYKNNMFFNTLLENSMQSMCKTFFPLTQYMEKDE
ncbi:MAG: phosphoenolpyruvate carboxylase, partial [Cyclobacteriaceae bacterium]|nr:phosphoenolpyruvate carboxylase [Cyclobacteriaceae bacterium]